MPKASLKTKLNAGSGEVAAVVVPANAKKYRAVFDFEGDAENDELPFKVGDTIVVLEEDESGWWTAQDVRGNTGVIPHNYIEELKWFMSRLREWQVVECV